MQNGRVLLIGESPLAGELAQVCQDAAATILVYPVEEALGEHGLDRLRRDAESVETAIEVMSESVETKRAIVAALDAALAPNAVLLTSVLSTTATLAASWTQKPDRVVGFATLPPVGQSAVVELAAGLLTDPSAVDRARVFFASIGLETAVVRDGVGLVLPRIVCGLINEAAMALADGVADAHDIDMAMRLGTHYPRGPLEWGDLIGLDVVLSVLRGLHEETGDERYRIAQLLKQYVRAGWLGRKTGRGFYVYPSR